MSSVCYAVTIISNDCKLWVGRILHLCGLCVLTGLDYSIITQQTTTGITTAVETFDLIHYTKYKLNKYKL